MRWIDKHFPDTSRDYERTPTPRTPREKVPAKWFHIAKRWTWDKTSGRAGEFVPQWNVEAPDGYVSNGKGSIRKVVR